MNHPNLIAAANPIGLAAALLFAAFDVSPGS